MNSMALQRVGFSGASLYEPKSVLLPLQARLMSQALRKITGNIKNANCLVIFINQIRMKIGVMFGSPETTTGGNALKFYSSVRLDIRRTGAVKEGEEVVGSETRVKIVKNKVAPPFRQADPLWQGHLPQRRDHRPRCAAGSGREVGCLVQLPGQQDRPGQGQRRQVPGRQSGRGTRDRGSDSPEAAGQQHSGEGDCR